MKLAWIIVLGLLLIPGPSPRAAEKPAIPEFCWDEGPLYDVPSDITFTIECLLKAIRAQNREAIVALMEKESQVACTELAPCRGIMDESMDQFIFPPTNARVAASGRLTFYELITKAESIDITFDVRINVTAFFTPRPGKARVVWQEGFMKDYFACTFKYSGKREMWVVVNGFCLTESDRLEIDDVTALPITNIWAWKPK